MHATAQLLLVPPSVCCVDHFSDINPIEKAGYDFKLVLGLDEAAPTFWQAHGLPQSTSHAGLFHHDQAQDSSRRVLMAFFTHGPGRGNGAQLLGALIAVGTDLHGRTFSVQIAVAG